MISVRLQLPEPLHEALTALSEGEGVSLNQFITVILEREAALRQGAAPRPDRAQQACEDQFVDMANDDPEQLTGANL